MILASYHAFHSIASVVALPFVGNDLPETVHHAGVVILSRDGNFALNLPAVTLLWHKVAVLLNALTLLSLPRPAGT